MLKSLWLGFKRHPLRFFGSGLLAYSTLWTIVSSINFFNPTIKFEGVLYYASFTFLSAIIGVVLVYQPKRISFKVNTSDTRINVYYGDIFKQKGYIAISVNEFFDSKIGLPVSPKSLHGIVINDFFGGHPDAFDRAILEQIESKKIEIVERSEGKNIRYPIGTTAAINANEHKFFLFALCNTDLETHKASTNLPTMINALNGLFDKARTNTGGESLILPLVGSGISGVGLPATQLLQLMILTIIDETKRSQICKEIDIVLHEDRFDEIDLELIKRQWS